MGMMRRGRHWLTVGTVLALLGAVTAERSPAAESRNVVVFAAASLKNALDESNAQWQRETRKQATISYAASSALAKQIESSAPADVFISADLEWMDYLAQRNLIRADSRTNLLGNRLVLVAPKASTAQTAIAPNFPLAALLGDGRLAMADTKAVPAGKYGKAALQALGVWPSVEGKIAQAENVRAALLFVSRGEAPLGIVYQTDAAADPSVKIVGVLPENTHPPIVYPIALTASSTNRDAAAFLTYLKSPAAQAVFAKQDFIVLK